MAAVVKEVMFVEVSQAVYLWFLVLEVDKSRYGLRVYLKGVDVLIKFFSLFPQLV